MPIIINYYYYDCEFVKDEDDSEGDDDDNDDDVLQNTYSVTWIAPLHKDCMTEFT